VSQSAAEPAPRTWREVVREQDGVLSRAQALSTGLTPDAWSWKIASGRWQLLCDGVAVTHSGEPTALQLRWAAVLKAGRDAALTGDAALVHFGAKRLEVVQYDVAIPTERRARRVESPVLTMVPHRIDKLKLWTAGHPHLRLVHRHAATLHAAAWASNDEQAEHRLTLAVQQRVTDPLSLRLTLVDMPRLPRHALLLTVLDDVELGATAQSELDLLRFCRRHGLPLPDQLQLKVRANGKTRYLDARWSWLRITVEVDGAHHMWVEQWNADTLRSLQLAVAHRGTREQLVRVTRAMLRHQEQEVATLLRQLLVP
jgi:hypothetical protein